MRRRKGSGYQDTYTWKTVRFRGRRYSVVRLCGVFVLKDTRPDEDGYVFHKGRRTLYAAKILGEAYSLEGGRALIKKAHLLETEFRKRLEEKKKEEARPVITSNQGTGDLGWTDRGDGVRLCKNDDRINALGDMDELSAWLTFVYTEPLMFSASEDLSKMGEALSIRMALFSGAKPAKMIPEADAHVIAARTRNLDTTFNIHVSFGMPSSPNRVCAMLNVARTVCRRAERSVWQVYRNWAGSDFASICEETAVWLNRLSDYLYALMVSYRKSAMNSQSSDAVQEDYASRR